MTCLLEEFPLFDGISTSVLNQISEKTTITKAKLNTLIIHENSMNEYVYFIKKGEVCVYREDKNKEKIVLAILSEGDFFGEMSVLENYEASASVMTTQSCEFIAFHDRYFIRIMKRYPKIASKLFSYMSQRIRHCDESIKTLSKSQCGDRIAAVIIHLAEKSGYRRKDSVIIKRLPYNYNIASLAGTTRESVCRTFSILEENEYITRNGRELVINDYPRFYEKYST